MNSTARAFSACLALLAFSAGQASEAPFEKKFAAQPGEILTLRSDFGNVEVIGTDASEVTVHVDIDGSRDAVRKYAVDAKKTADGVEVEGHRTTDWWWDWSWMFDFDLDVRYKIQVPRGYRVRIDNSRGAVAIDAVDGKISIDVSRGDVRGTRLTGDVDISASRGDIKLEQIGGKVRVRASRGAVRVGLASSIRGVDLQTSRGDVIVTVPKQLAADLDVHTSRGEIRNQVPVMTTRRMSEHSYQALKGALNGGGIPLNVDTSRGDVEIRAGS